MEEEQISYLELNAKEKLAIRNQLLAEYLNEGIDMEDALTADLNFFVEVENYGAAQMYKDLLKDLHDIDELANRKI